MIKRLKLRSEFLAVGEGPSQAAGSVIVRAIPNDKGEIRAGFTATKKLGNAVVRNRAKRRLRAIADIILPLYGAADHDYVIIARSSIIERGAAALMEDVTRAVKALKKA